MIKPLLRSRLPIEKFVPSASGEGEGGDGTISGLSPSSIAVPVIPTNEERKNPGFERSMRYHSTGLTRAKVSDTCKVDCQGSLRCRSISHRNLDLVTRKECYVQ